MRFYVVIRRKKDIGSFRKAKWVTHLDWIYEKRGDALEALKRSQQQCPNFEFSILRCDENGCHQ